MRYNVVLADPAWDYRQFSDTAHGAAKAHYKCMSPQELRDLPVSSWASDDAVLALWATLPHIDQAVDLVRAWDFEHVSCIPWVKVPRDAVDQPEMRVRCGIGWWAQATTEILMIARRGKVVRKKADPVYGLFVGEDKPILYHPIGKHSRKPMGVHEYLSARLDGPYLELFATQETAGWDCRGRDLGWEITKDGIINAQQMAS